MVFNFFSNPNKARFLQTEHANQLPGTQRQVNKHPQYDILLKKKGGGEILPQQETNVAKHLLILFPEEE